MLTNLGDFIYVLAKQICGPAESERACRMRRDHIVQSRSPFIKVAPSTHVSSLLYRHRAF